MLKLLHPDDAGRLREFFCGAQYTSGRLQNEMGLSALPSRRLRTLPRMLDVTRQPTTLNTLVRWFFIGVPVARKQAREWIPDWVLKGLLDAGALTERGDSFEADLRITPLEKLLIASDSALQIESSKPSDLVLWPNPTTRLLSWFTVRRPTGRTLDLGTGCGSQAIQAAAHSETVVATDINPKAIEFTRFNARLNGVENIECLAGDSFAPVEGQKFDLIVANPPFFITPSKQYMFCDNNLDLDQFCRRLAREAPAYLNENGYFQMLCEWAQVAGEKWQDRLAEWLRGSGCDCWVLKGTSTDPSLYAQDRFHQSAPYSAETDDATFTDWMDYYRERKVEAIHGGMIVMRRRTGRNWIRIEDTPGRSPKPFGDSVVRMYANRDFLEANSSDEQMLSAKFKLFQDTQLEQELRPLDNGWQRTSTTLRLKDGLPFSLPVQPLVAEFLGSCDGQRTLGELTGELATKVNANLEQVRRECLAVMRQLVERGFVVPVC